jgi:hypothetical protein
VWFPAVQAVIYSLHEAAKGEMPGKASNVNAAVRNFVGHLCTDASTVMLTIIDAGEEGGGGARRRWS